MPFSKLKKLQRWGEPLKEEPGAVGGEPLKEEPGAVGREPLEEEPGAVGGEPLEEEPGGEPLEEEPGGEPPDEQSGANGEELFSEDLGADRDLLSGKCSSCTDGLSVPSPSFISIGGLLSGWNSSSQAT